MMTKAEFLEQLLQINSKYSTELIGKAFDKGKKLHDGQLRKSGEPYLSLIHISCNRKDKCDYYKEGNNRF